jgi:L-fucose mutarotase/ribose pyranase (RbsD/FucU family)
MKKFGFVSIFVSAVMIAGFTQTVTTTRTNTHVNRFNGISSFNVETRGKIEVTDDDKDIKSISSDGYLEITKVTFGSKRKIVITPEGNGLKREYYEGRERIAFEPEGRKWLSEILPELVRTTTIAAESRVARFYKRGGTGAVLNEIDALEGGHVKSHYANVLMGLNLAVKDYSTVIERISSTMDSDHYLTEFLERNMSKFLQDIKTTDAVFAACGKMDSDHYKTQVIKEALENQQPSMEAIASILKASGDMDSDHYKTEVLSTLLSKDNLSDAVVAETISATMKLESDHYRSVALKKALNKPNLSSNSFKRAVESIKEIESDHYKTEVLTDLLENKLSNDVNTAIVLVSENIESDHYKTIVLTSLVKRQNLDEASFKKLIEVGSHSDNDHYASQFLRTTLQAPNVSTANLITIISAAANIDSDHYITEVLTAAAPKVKTGDNSLKEAYRAAAKKIESETYYGRALRAIE